MTEAEYRAARAKVDRGIRIQPDKDTAEFQAMMDLIDAIVAYEEEHFPIGSPTPEEAAAFRREQEGS